MVVDANYDQRMADERREENRRELQEIMRRESENDLREIENEKILRDQQIILHCDMERIRRHGNTDDRRSLINRDLQWQINNAETSRSQEIRYHSELDKNLDKSHKDFMQLLMEYGTQPQIEHAKKLRDQQIIRRGEEEGIREDTHRHKMHRMRIPIEHKKRARELEELQNKQKREKQRDTGWQHREFRRKLDAALLCPINLHRHR